MDQFKIDQLTKELVSAKIKQLPDPCVAAASLVKDTLRVAFKGLEAGSVADAGIVEQACQGGMTALLLNDQNLAKGGVLILQAAAEIAEELNLDQMELMKSAMKGLSDMKRFARPDVLHDLETAIEARYHGAGEVFTDFCRQKAPAP